MSEHLIEEKIKWDLSYLSDQKLREIKNYIDSILEKDREKNKKIVKMKGEWKNLGFEKLENLEEEIRKIRKELEKHIIIG